MDEFSSSINTESFPYTPPVPLPSDDLIESDIIYDDTFGLHGTATDLTDNGGKTTSSTTQTEKSTSSIGIQAGISDLSSAFECIRLPCNDADDSKDSSPDSDTEDYSSGEEYDDDSEECERQGTSTNDGLVKDDYSWCFTAMESLEELFKFCPRCGASSSITRKVISGISLGIHYTCSGYPNHAGIWRSSPYTNKRPVINVLFSTAASLCGISFTAIQGMLNALNIPVVSKDTYFKHVRVWL